MTSIQLPIMTLQDSLYRSPKRKRVDNPTEPRLLTTGIGHNREYLLSNDIQSPSHKVASKLQKLGLQSPVESSGQRNSYFDIVALGTSDAQIPTDSTTPRAARSMSPPQSSSFTFEMPSAVSTRESSVSEESRSSDDTSDQFWRESEITGYSPEDPDEDSYGVNGVGYQKPPAVAYAISQKRKQQIAKYRSRETKEARQRRGERRMNAMISGSPQPTSTSETTPKSDRKAVRIVHFAHG